MAQKYSETNFMVTIFGYNKTKPVILENNSITNFTFIEDIFNSVPLAVLEFIDRGGLVEYLPLIGREMVSIMYGPDTSEGTSVDTKTRAMNFVTYDIDFRSEIQTAGAAVTTVTMRLVDPFYLTMNNMRYSKSWSNKTGSDIIKDICTYMIGAGTEFEFALFEKSEDTIGNDIDNTTKVFIMPYWTPTETIRWLIKRMRSGTGPGYLFYCNNKGFNLVTMETLLGGTPDAKAYFFGATDKSMYLDENRVLNWKMYPPGNQALPHLSGAITYSPRFDTKDMRESPTWSEEEYTKYTFHGSESLYPKINIANSNIVMMGGDYTTIDNAFRSDWIKRYMQQLQMEILVKGHVRRYAGMLIDLRWNIMSTGQEKEYAGRYMIKSIEHIFTPAAQPAYKQMIKIVKTSYKDTVAGGLS